MIINDTAEFEAALARVVTFLDSPPPRGSAADTELGALLQAIESYNPSAPMSGGDQLSSRIMERAAELAHHADTVRSTFERAKQRRGFGGLPMDGEGMGPTTGAR